MRICIITPNYPLYEGEGEATAGLFVYDFAHELKLQGQEVYVFTQDRKGRKMFDHAHASVPVKFFDWAGSKDSKKLGKMNFYNPIDIIKVFDLLLNGKRELIKFVDEKKIDHCIAMWAIPSGFFARHVRDKLNIPYSVWVLGSDVWAFIKKPILKKILSKVLKDATTIFADGLELARTVQQFSHKECEFLPSTRRLPIQHEEGAKINALKTNFLFIGRYEKEKGVDILIEAMHLLIKEGFDAYLYMFGGGTLYKYLKKKIDDRNLQKNVILGDYASAFTCVDYLQKCSCLVIPSRRESIPVVFSDAMKCGIPVIVSDVGDMGSLVHRYQVGKVVHSENPIELKKAMSSFIKEGNRDQYQEKILKLSKLFDLRAITKRYISALNKS